MEQHASNQARYDDGVENDRPLSASSTALPSQLFGPTLLKESREVDTAQELEGKTVGVFFAAPWSKDCVEFSDSLKQAYNKSLIEKGVEIVWAPVDTQQGDFAKFHRRQPWLALPREVMASPIGRRLVRKCRQEEVPHLVFIDPSGRMLTREGVKRIRSDNRCRNFPWTPKLFSEALGVTFLRGREVETIERFDSKIIAILFSKETSASMWYGPGNVGFAATLAKYHKAYLKRGIQFEVIFCSADSNQKAFQRTYKEIVDLTTPNLWLAIPFSDSGRRKGLAFTLRVTKNPQLVIVDSDGRILNPDAASAVSNDPNGSRFPWARPLVRELKSGWESPGTHTAAVVCLMESWPAELQEAATAELETVSQRYADAVHDNNEEHQYIFFAARRQSEEARKLRKTFGLPRASYMDSVVDEAPKERSTSSTARQNTRGQTATGQASGQASKGMTSKGRILFDDNGKEVEIQFTRAPLGFALHDDDARVSEVMGNAEKLGVKAGWRLKKIEDKDLQDSDFETIRRDLKSFSQSLPRDTEESVNDAGNGFERGSEYSKAATNGETDARGDYNLDGDPFMTAGHLDTQHSLPPLDKMPDDETSKNPGASAQVKKWDVTVDRSKGGQLGIALNTTSLLIDRVTDAGLFTEFNKECPDDQRVTAGDQVLQVNGKTQAKEVIAECKKAQVLVFTMQRSAGAQAGAVSSSPNGSMTHREGAGYPKGSETLQERGTVEQEKGVPKALLVFIDDKDTYLSYSSLETEITAEFVEEFIEDVEQGRVRSQKLKKDPRQDEAQAIESCRTCTKFEYLAGFFGGGGRHRQRSNSSKRNKNNMDKRLGNWFG